MRDWHALAADLTMWPFDRLRATGLAFAGDAHTRARTDGDSPRLQRAGRVDRERALDLLVDGGQRALQVVGDRCRAVPGDPGDLDLDHCRRVRYQLAAERGRAVVGEPAVGVHAVL